MKLNNLFVLTLLLFSMMFVSADSLGIFKIGENVTLYQGCDSSSYANISSIYYPNSSLALGRTVMIGSNNYYTYNFTNTQTKGIYTVNGYCDENGQYTGWSYNFEINATGSDFSQGKSIAYLIIFIICLFLFIGLLWAGFIIPYKNESDQMTGYIIQVSNMKYLKIICFGLAYICLIATIYFLEMISYAYLDMEFITNLLHILFIGLVALTLPIFILLSYILIANWIRDSKIKEQLERGLSVRDG